MTEIPYIVVCHEDDPQWLAERTKSIGASDTPAILGLVSWGSATSVQVSKWGLSEEAPHNDIFEIGHVMEPAILGMLSKRVGNVARPFGKLLRSKEYPWLHATPDGLVDEEGVFAQCKTGLIASEWSNSPPYKVWTQVQHEMLVTGHSYCYVAATLMHSKFVWSKVERDEDFIQKTLFPILEKLWGQIERMESCDPDGSKITSQAISTLHPQDNGLTIGLDVEYLVDTGRIIELQETVKGLEDEIGTMKNRIRLAIGENTYGALSGGDRWSYKRNRKGTRVLTYKGLKE